MEGLAPPPGLGFEVHTSILPPVDEAGVRTEKDLSPQYEDSAMANIRLCWENAMRHEQRAAEQLQLAGACAFPQDDWWLPTDPWAAAQAAEAGLRPGVMATLHSLKNAAELNGVSGIIEYWHADSGRWVLRLPDGEEKFAKPENLVASLAPPVGFYTSSCFGMPDWQRPQGQTPHSRRSRIDNGKAVSHGGARSGTQSLTSSFNSDVSATTVGSMSSAPSFSGDDGDSLLGKKPTNDGHTTVMMRNIPNNYTREMLLKLLDERGLSCLCDLIYLPIDFSTEVGLGYAFINLVSEDKVQAFQEALNGYSEWDVASKKVCEVVRSNPLQGLHAHIERYRNSPVMHETVPDTYRPVLFSNGVRVPFPLPTKRIRAPRLRRPGKRECVGKTNGNPTDQFSGPIGF